MRCPTVITDVSAKTATTPNSKNPFGPAPKNNIGTPSPRMRSARCAIPTLHSRPRPSARALAYDTVRAADYATSAVTTPTVAQRSGRPPFMKNKRIPPKMAASPTLSSVES